MAECSTHIQQAHGCIHHIMIDKRKIVIIYHVVTGGRKVIILLPSSRAKNLTQGILCLDGKLDLIIRVKHPQIGS